MMKGIFFFSLLIPIMTALSLCTACAEPALAPIPTPRSTPSAVPTPSPNPSPTLADVIELKYISPFQVAEAPTEFGYYFLDYIEQKSGGKVQFERYPGGVVGGIFEMLPLIKSGSADLATILAERTPEIPLSHFPVWAVGEGAEKKAADMFNNIIFENLETSVLIQKEWEENNVKLLFTNSTIGVSAIISKTPFTSLIDLKDKKMGGSVDQGMASLGITQVFLDPSDLYEALSRGLVDCLQISTSAVVALKIYKIGKYALKVPIEYRRPGWPVAINMDTWNRLPYDVQAIFSEAGEATREYSYKIADSEAAKLDQIIIDAGVTVGFLPQEDLDYILDFNYVAWMNSFIADATNVGKLEQAQVIAKYCDELRARYQ